MNIVSYNDCSELDTLEDAWEALSEQEVQFVPSFTLMRRELEGGDAKFRILIAIDNSQIKAIACFIYWNTVKRYEIATRTLFRLPLKELSLFGSSVLGQPSENVVREFFQLVIKESGFDLINVGEVFIHSPLYRAIISLPNGAMAFRAVRKKRLRWLIQLPPSFDEYIASLSKSIARDCKKCEREGPDFRVMQSPGDVETFLLDAEKISQSTYQWKLGYGVRNDDSTRRHFDLLAKNGNLRCYIIYLRGAPCAFGWGELSHGTFVFRQTGYDPQYRKISPGTTLTLRMIRDLIENTNCEVFDFLWGGDDGYKSRLGNLSLSCVSMQVAQIYKPYPLLLIMLDQTLNLSKNLVGLIIERGAAKRRLRAVLRRYGIGTF